MKELDIQTTQHENGFRIVKIHLDSFHSVTNFLAIRSGSRYENKKNNGIAHFLEHLVFKGTEKYPNSLSVAQAIEGIGGYFNAWTSLDHTAYWNTVPSSHFQLGVEMPFELAFRALLKPEDLERERGVIIEEIRMIQDDPARYVDDIATEITFAGHQLSQHVIGTEENIRQMALDQFLEYRNEYYTPSQSLFIAIGDVKNRPIDDVLSRFIQHLPAKPVTLPKSFSGPSVAAVKLLSKKTDQTHFMLTVADPELALNQSNRFAAVLLNAVLGRGMSSRLFTNIRERQGLAYAIRSSFVALEDTGTISIYGGVNTAKTFTALEAVQDELKKLQSELVPDDELRKAKNQITGSYDLRSDDPISLAQWYGSSALLGMTETFAEAKALIESVTAEQVRDAARRIFALERQTLAVIGPHDDPSQFKQILGLA